MKKKGVLLINLGSPSEPKVGAIRKFLREFLSDPRVIDIPFILRWMILNFFILPFRPPKTEEKYKAIWQEKSPLILHGENLAKKVGHLLGKKYSVHLAMRYGEPNIESVIQQLITEGITELVIFPLYPQYASSSTGSTLEEVFRILGKSWNIPNIKTVEPCFDHPRFIEAWASVGKKYVKNDSDHFLFSFHGLPERQIIKSDPKGDYCLQSKGCCEKIGSENSFCYRAQCFSTAKKLAASLNIPESKYTICFQSRMGRTPWILPFTPEVIQNLARDGKRRLVVFCPAFVADCLETLQEIAIEEKGSFLSFGGEELTMVPSLNSEDIWCEVVADLVERRAAQ